MTVRQLCSHLGGVRHYDRRGEDHLATQEMDKAEYYLKEPFASTDASIDLFREDELLSSPGKVLHLHPHLHLLLLLHLHLLLHLLQGIFCVAMQRDPAGLDPDSTWAAASYMAKCAADTVTIAIMLITIASMLITIITITTLLITIASMLITIAIAITITITTWWMAPLR